MPPFRFQDVFKRIVEVGWGAKPTFLVWQIDVETEEQTEGSAVPPAERSVTIEIDFPAGLDIDGSNLKNLKLEYHHRETVVDPGLSQDPPNPTIPWPPEVEFPIPTAAGIYEFFWTAAGHETIEFGQEAEPPSDKVIVLATAVVIWPDGDPDGPQGPYDTEGDAEAAIELFRANYPGWALIGYDIIPVGGGAAFADTRGIWKSQGAINCRRFANTLLDSTAEDPVWDITFKIKLNDGASDDSFFRAILSFYLVRGFDVTLDDTGALNFDSPDIEYLTDATREAYRNSDNPDIDMNSTINVNFEPGNESIEIVEGA